MNIIKIVLPSYLRVSMKRRSQLKSGDVVAITTYYKIDGSATRSTDLYYKYSESWNVKYSESWNVLASQEYDLTSRTTVLNGQTHDILQGFYDEIGDQDYHIVSEGSNNDIAHKLNKDHIIIPDKEILKLSQYDPYFLLVGG